MKSGLKVRLPDVYRHIISVATIAAMKSGLKDASVVWDTGVCHGSNHCRDEKRTESVKLMNGKLDMKT